ncbi:uncharacterized protein LOC125659071 isoform X1 [Ostrea edulis]|uniref:uncharacterized protein LOC125659071 isoform X1 n=1 Tax=Ostrea edulis TaxID=37623 RepID=UPI002095237A|nr:uncharacterized protein LOC125659071 isoform X1 [Ostrea edulis]
MHSFKYKFVPTESSSSGSGRMERIRPEKTPRQKVQSVWRNVRWAETFPDESLTMESVELTPNFALRKIVLLFETKKYDECATLIRRLNCVTFGNILQEVPMEVLLDSMPFSLSILEALYVKLFETTLETFPKENLHMDLLIRKMVACFARMSQSGNRAEKNCNSYYPSCRNILRVVSYVDPNVKQHLKQKKKALERCLKHMGQHGLVESSCGSLMNLHDALKLEFDKIVFQYRNALQKLDELSLSAKHPTSSSVTSGKAPSGVSHQRLMQITRADVQSRIIKNKTLFNIVEPAVTNQCLKKLFHILEKRIEYDKLALFHDTELRKHCDNISDEAYMSVVMKQFCQGYSIVLQLLKEVSELDEVTSEDDDAGMISSDEDIMTPITRMDRSKTFNGFTHVLPHKTNGLRPSIISGPFPCKPVTAPSNGLMNGHATVVPSNLSSLTSVFLTNGSRYSNGHTETIEKLKEEVHTLRSELQKSQEAIKNLQEREKQLQEKLSTEPHSSFNGGYNSHFEDLSLASRTSELTRQYGDLYASSRMSALDALDGIGQLDDLSVLKEKILFSVVVLSFRGAQQAVHELRGKVRHLLNLPHPDAHRNHFDPLSNHMEAQVAQYLCKTVGIFDVSATIEEVCSQIYATLYDYPVLKDCQGLKMYVTACVQVAWGLSVQNPPYLIMYDARQFHPEMHTRFHSSNPESEEIKNFLWPALTEGYGGPCVYKGVVIT